MATALADVPRQDSAGRVTKAPAAPNARRQFADAFQKARVAVGKSQSQIARETKIDRGHIGAVERLDANPTVDTMALLARSVDMDVRISLVPRSRKT